MKSTLKSFAAAVVLAIGTLASGPALADLFLVQVVDTTEGELFINTYKNGTLIQNANIGGESYGNGYGLGWNPNGVLAADVDVRVNIYDADGVTLSDTWHLFGPQGAGVIQIPFFSDVEGQPLTPLPNPTLTLIETGGFQTVLENDLANGDHYVWQFASDVEVPEPGTLALLGLSLAGLALLRRRPQ